MGSATLGIVVQWILHGTIEATFTRRFAMMPADILTEKAFLVSLCQLDAPLPETLRSQLRNLDLSQDASALHDFARREPSLKSAYDEARQLLSAASRTAETGKNSAPRENKDSEMGETENVSTSLPENPTIEQIRDRLENNYADRDIPTQTAKILCASDPLMEALKLLSSPQ